MPKTKGLKLALVLHPIVENRPCLKAKVWKANYMVQYGMKNILMTFLT